MVVLSEIRFESLQLTVQKLTVSGLTPNRENFAIEESFSDLDFNVIQCFFYQMYMRYAKKNVPPYDDGTMMSWVHQMNTGDSKLRDVAIRCGYSLYKVAKCYLFSIHHTGMIAFMEEPDLFPNVEKSFEVVECFAEDPLCSTVVNIRKNCTGKEFECYLETRLRALNVCFETEAELRLSGKPKTPDILLSIPMFVHTKEGFCYLVNWIDSKGLFADAETIKEHEIQLKGYVNRYGHGLVIYWHGYVENFGQIDNVHVVDYFPDVWKSPSGEFAEKRLEKNSSYAAFNV